MRAPLVFAHGRGRSFVGGGGELVNAFLQAAPEGAKDPAHLISCPGSVIFSTMIFDDEKLAALQPAFGDKVVAITDQSTYVVSSDGTRTRLGAGLSGRVSTATNGDTVAAVNGTTGYWITESAVSVISDPDFEPADTVDFLAGFFIFNRKGTGQYFISNVYSTDIDALDFATAESAPDDTVAVVVVRRELWLLGTSSVEVHSLTGGTFPFSALTGVAITFGCVAPYSALAVDQSVCWLSPNGIVYRSAGYSAQRMSTHEIEEELQSLRASWADAFAWTYIEDGHQFYVLTVGDQTFAFDFSTRLWHKRRTIGETRYAANCACDAFDKTLIGDDKGRILELSRDYDTDPDGAIIIEIGSLPLRFPRESSVYEYEVDAEVGNGGTATLQVSEDDGHTWSDKIDADLGATGDYRKRLLWTNLGSFDRDFRTRIEISGPFRKRMAAAAEVMVG